MLTRCPSCATHFRVTAEQLKLRAGRVRCGECQHVFNALDTLIEEPLPPIAPPPPGPAPGQHPAFTAGLWIEPAGLAPADAASSHSAETSAVGPDSDAVPPVEFDPVAAPPVKADSEATSPAEPDSEATSSVEPDFDAAPPIEPETEAAPPAGPGFDERQAPPGDIPPGETTALHDELAAPMPTIDALAAEPAAMSPADTPDIAEDDTATDRQAAVDGADREVGFDAEDADFIEPPPRRWPWVVGGMLALALLAVQAAIMYRVELATLWPELRPLLVATCEPLACEVGLPAKVGLVGIEASDLHPDTAQRGRLALTATLKNRAPFAQQFPHLELTLTDTADKAIVRKVLGPEQYLPRGTAIANGMTPNADLTVAITIDAGELPASGYRLYIFYP